MRSNLKLITSNNIGGIFADVSVANPNSITLHNQTTKPKNGTQSYVASDIVLDATRNKSVYIDYTMTQVSGSSSYITRIGRVFVNFPLDASNENQFGHAIIFDEFNEVNLKAATGVGSVTINLGAVVSRRKSTLGDPVIEQEFDDAVANTGGTGTAAYATKYGEAHTLAVDQGAWYGYILYDNSSGTLDISMTYTIKRFA